MSCQGFEILKLLVSLAPGSKRKVSQNVISMGKKCQTQPSLQRRMSDAKRVAPAFDGGSVGAGTKRRKHTMAGLKALRDPKAMGKNPKKGYIIYINIYYYRPCSFTSTLFCFIGLPCSPTSF